MKSGSSQSTTQPVASAPLAAVPQAAPPWMQQYQQLQAAKQPQTSPDQLMQMLGMNQPQQSPGLQAYMNMRGGGHYGGVIPGASTGRPIFGQRERPMMEQKNPTTFGQSPWPGVMD